jgi:hypothetical protein
MKLILSKNVEGIDRRTNTTRLHAKTGDVLFVLTIKLNPEGFVEYYKCDSLYYPNEYIIVFPSQIEKIEDDLPTNEESTQEPDEFYMSRDFNPENPGIFAE